MTPSLWNGNHCKSHFARTLWFGVLLGSKSQVVKSPTYDSMKVVSYMLVFNVDSGPTRPGDLLDFGGEEIRRLTRMFQTISERAGCKISSIQDQQISLKIMVIMATLSVSVSKDLIHLSSDGPPVAEFDLTPAVNRWFQRDRSKGERAQWPHLLNQSGGCV